MPVNVTLVISRSDPRIMPYATMAKARPSMVYLPEESANRRIGDYFFLGRVLRIARSQAPQGTLILERKKDHPIQKKVLDRGGGRFIDYQKLYGCLSSYGAVSNLNEGRPIRFDGHQGRRKTSGVRLDSPRMKADSRESNLDPQRIKRDPRQTKREM